MEAILLNRLKWYIKNLFLKVYKEFGKRQFDILVSLVLLFFCMPIILIFSFILMLENKSFPIFFQTRIGFKYNEFTILKFKTILDTIGDIPSAEVKSMKIKFFSKIARKTNIDELPQLFNVLFGDMSIIGPRPALQSQKKLLSLRKERKINEIAKPGITGLAQVNAFDMMSDEEKVNFDLKYCLNISFYNDIVIVLKTIHYLFRKQPIY